MRILYLTSAAAWKPSGNSIQLLSEIRELSKRGHRVDLLCMIHRGQAAALRDPLLALRHELETAGCGLHEFVFHADHSPWLQPLLLPLYAIRLLRLQQEHGWDILQAHDIRSANVAALCRRWRPGHFGFLYDMHGAALAEGVYSGILREGDPVYRMRRAWEVNALRAADAVFVVSNVFKDWVTGEYGTVPERIHVTPSSTSVPRLVDAEQIQRRRNELGLGPGPVLLYSGSLLKWQRAEDLIRLFPALRARIPGLQLLVLSRQADQAREIARSAEIDPGSFLAMSSAPEDVQDLMALGDLGVLLRHNHLLNRVASPVKFADYLAAGLPVMVSAGVGDTETLIRDSGLGVILEPELDPDRIAECMRPLLAGRDETQRQACNLLARRHFSWEETMKVFDRVYEVLRTKEPETGGCR